MRTKRSDGKINGINPILSQVFLRGKKFLGVGKTNVHGQAIVHQQFNTSSATIRTWLSYLKPVRFLILIPIRTRQIVIYHQAVLISITPTAICFNKFFTA